MTGPKRPRERFKQQKRPGRLKKDAKRDKKAQQATDPFNLTVYQIYVITYIYILY